MQKTDGEDLHDLITWTAPTFVLYFHSPAARENTAARSCNIQPYCLLTHQIIYIYLVQVIFSLMFQSHIAGYSRSEQSGNLRNLEIALHILRIPRLCRQSRDCVTRVRNLKIAHTCYAISRSHAPVCPTASVLLCSLISGVCLHTAI